MKVLGYRYGEVSEHSEAMVDFLQNKLGLKNSWEDTEDYRGGIFKAGESWLEFWHKNECMNALTMLQIVVDEGDDFASFAKEQGVEIHGPIEENGEKIYSVQAPNGMPVTIVSSQT
ncbi:MULTISPECIES: VOC family protein [Pontibacillus]|uniref:VOC domain-containing protein n=1 Tax=Pontibacillus chungwhensis TaxID=265426 RepID=A0ABY8V0T4_9BACI|nr:MULTISPECIES: hypothetical protein [Pontibacillus]MCD5325233.1 hypothetical protein [Pontibacillus sp. HN14]WIF97481.1 hypothetical protein QNI29_17355 [Pontibacillus chungwhensis]